MEDLVHPIFLKSSSRMGTPPCGILLVPFASLCLGSSWVCSVRVWSRISDRVTSWLVISDVSSSSVSSVGIWAVADEAIRPVVVNLLKEAEISAISGAPSLSSLQVVPLLPSLAPVSAEDFESVSESKLASVTSPRFGVWARFLTLKWSVCYCEVIGAPFNASRNTRSMVFYVSLIVSLMRILRTWYNWRSVKTTVGCPTGKIKASVVSKYAFRRALLFPRRSCNLGLFDWVADVHGPIQPLW